MDSSSWSTQQLAEFIAGVSIAETEAAAARAAVERVAEALGANVAAIVCDGELVAAVGSPADSVPADELERVMPGAARSWLDVPGAGRCAAVAVTLEYPPGATLVLARPGALTSQETGLLRGMARVAAMTMRMLSVLSAQRAAREEIERLAGEQAALRRVATLVAKAAAPGEVFCAVAEGLHSAVGVPISVEGRLWGVVAVASMSGEPLPADTEARLAGFTELVATAIANAQAQAELTASRARIVATADETRRRIERDLHDGAQQRLVSLAAKHAEATAVHINVEGTGDVIRLAVRDDGIGGADPARGSGLVGLKDRVAAVGGTLSVRSRPGEGTTLLAELPVRPVQLSVG